MILCASQLIFEVITINSFYVANDTVLIFDRWNIKNRRIGLDRLVFNDRPAYDTVVNGRPARTLYFSRETRKEEGGAINTVPISNNDNFKNRKNKAAINYWPGE
jgi:hypothetical protein